MLGRFTKVKSSPSCMSTRLFSPSTFLCRVLRQVGIASTGTSTKLRAQRQVKHFPAIKIAYLTDSCPALSNVSRRPNPHHLYHHNYPGDDSKCLQTRTMICLLREQMGSVGGLLHLEMVPRESLALASCIPQQRATAQLLSRQMADFFTVADNHFPVSHAHISKEEDKAMDKATPSANAAPAGVSIRNGPVVEDKMDVDEPATNGTAKRKARASISKAVNYNDEEDSDESTVPLVCTIIFQCRCLCILKVPP